jgi:hypothetical protein
VGSVAINWFAGTVTMTHARNMPGSARNSVDQYRRRLLLAMSLDIRRFTQL